MSFRVGADARSITPELSPAPYLAGFDSERMATSVHDELMVRTIAIQHGNEEPWVLSSCDLIGLARVPRAEGRSLVCCTHTHHGPDTIGFWGRPLEGVSGRNPEYLDLVRLTVAASRDAAIASLEAADLSAGSVSVPELVDNFRDPDVIDDELSIVVATRADQSVIATLASYPCHPEVLDPANTEITADYPGHFCRSVEGHRGGTAVFVAGGLGGMLSPRTEIHTHEEAERFGKVLAAAVDEVDLVAVGSGFSSEHSDVLVELANPLYRLAMEMSIVDEVEWRDQMAVTEVSLTRIGDLVLAGVPGELLPKLGLQLKERLRSHGVRVPIIVGLANDELGYILAREDFVTPEDYFDPGRQYEESMSVGPDLGPAVMGALQRLTEVVCGPGVAGHG